MEQNILCHPSIPASPPAVPQEADLSASEPSGFLLFIQAEMEVGRRMLSTYFPRPLSTEMRNERCGFSYLFPCCIFSIRISLNTKIFVLFAIDFFAICTF
jgi:hypothetical protein